MAKMEKRACLGIADKVEWYSNIFTKMKQSALKDFS